MFNLPIKNNRQGFTLVELMIVITVIAILATIAAVSFTRVQKQARDTKRKGDLRSLSTALQAYFTEKTAYPTTAAGTAALAPTYIPVVPTDPINSGAYTYNNNATSGTYSICATLEAPGDATKPTWKVSTLNAGGYATAEAMATCAAE